MTMPKPGFPDPPLAALRGLEKPLVLYHRNCSDGFGAAWAASTQYPDAEFVAVEHSTPPPDVRGRDVVIVDFSYKRPILEAMIREANRIVLLDHHKSAQEDLDGLVDPKFTVVFDMKRSGAGIAWDSFVGGKRNWIINVVEDADLWTWRLPNSAALIEAIRARPWTFPEWSQLATRGNPGLPLHEQVLREGNAILQAKKAMVDLVVGYAHEVELFGHKVLAANCPHFLNSETGHELAKGRPFAVTYYQERDGRWKLSFRSNDGFDTTTVSSRLGGGGHKAASGATVDALPWATSDLASRVESLAKNLERYQDRKIPADIVVQDLNRCLHPPQVVLSG